MKEKKYPRTDAQVLYSAKCKEIEKQIEETAALLETLREQHATEEKNSFITCYNCKSLLPVNSLTFIQTYWYVRPYSCAGGDYYKQGEARFECTLCGKECRSIYYDPGFEDLKKSFIEIKEVYNDRG